MGLVLVGPSSLKHSHLVSRICPHQHSASIFLLPCCLSLSQPPRPPLLLGCSQHCSRIPLLIAHSLLHGLGMSPTVPSLPTRPQACWSKAPRTLRLGPSSVPHFNSLSPQTYVCPQMEDGTNCHQTPGPGTFQSHCTLSPGLQGLPAEASLQSVCLDPSSCSRTIPVTSQRAWLPPAPHFPPRSSREILP